ncbi:hypothetical protein ACJZ2D_014619 [Fusarium nematophilum]
MNSTTLNTYAGNPIELDDSFRLVQVQPGRRDEPLTIRLVNSQLGACPPYEALSYVWGDTACLSEVLVTESGTGKQTTMNITANCHAALTQLRRPDAPRTLWIDAICINQSSIPERNHQLGLMARIYQTASQVVVYLGEATASSDAAMRLLRNIHDGQEDNSDQPKSLIQNLFQRPWFSRVWVLQEISLARQAVFVCGEEEVEWDVFRSFYHWNNTSKWIETLPYAIKYPATRDRRGRGYGYYVSNVSYGEMLQGMLMATRHCGATDPRDKLYAILPMLDFKYEEVLVELDRDSPELEEYDQGSSSARDRPPPLDQVRISANYHHSVQQIYTNLAVTLLESTGLGILSMNLGSPRPMKGIPSWVPDWSSTSAYCWPGTNPPEWAVFFFAGFAEESKRQWGTQASQPGLPDAWRVSGHSSSGEGEARARLHLKTIPVGSIQRIGDICDIKNNVFPMRQWISVAPDPKFQDKSSGAKETFARRGPLALQEENLRSLPPFLRTLAIDNVPTVGRWGRSWPMFGRKGRKNGSSEKMPLCDIFNDEGSYGVQAKVLLQACNGRRLFVTDTGYIGLAPATAAVGDTVHVVEGAALPYVFRSAASGESFQLVGEAYVHGIMYGEIWDGAGDGNGTVSTTEIVVE